MVNKDELRLDVARFTFMTAIPEWPEPFPDRLSKLTVSLLAPGKQMVWVNVPPLAVAGWADSTVCDFTGVIPLETIDGLVKSSM
jgi:hypothetical protein